MPPPQLTTVPALDPVELEAVRRIMDDAFEGDFDDDDWEHAGGGLHVVVRDGGTVVAHASVVERVLEVDGRPFPTGYLEAVATAPARQGEGFGRLAVTEATAIVRRGYELGGLGTGEHGFYEKLGWERWAGPTYVRRDGCLERSEQDDDGVMVLRFGPSAGVDLRAAISCEARAGDDW